MAKFSYGLKFPLELDRNNKFVSIQEVIPNIRQKLKNIILTSPGEKIMDPEFGIGIKRYLFENVNGIVSVSFDGGERKYDIEDFQANFVGLLSTQIRRYSNDIQVNEVLFEQEENILHITLNYTFQTFITDEFTISVSI